MIKIERFGERAHIPEELYGKIFSKYDSVPLDYDKAEEKIMRQLNDWAGTDPSRKIVSIQGPTRNAEGGPRSGYGTVTLTVLYEDMA